VRSDFSKCRDFTPSKSMGIDNKLMFKDCDPVRDRQEWFLEENGLVKPVSMTNKCLASTTQTHANYMSNIVPLVMEDCNPDNPKVCFECPLNLRPVHGGFSLTNVLIISSFTVAPMGIPARWDPKE
jgi:hypothetical protein